MAHLDTIDKCLALLFKSDIKVEWLLETDVGKRVQALNSRTRNRSQEDMEKLHRLSNSILDKWKHYVLRTIFDEEKPPTSFAH